jgi:hypothetical protein
VPPLTPPAFRLSPSLPVTRYAAAYASSVMEAGDQPDGPGAGTGAVTVAWGPGRTGAAPGPRYLITSAGPGALFLLGQRYRLLRRLAHLELAGTGPGSFGPHRRAPACHTDGATDASDTSSVRVRIGNRPSPIATGGNGMTAQPDIPSPDTGSYEVIHLGGRAAVVVPVTDFLRLVSVILWG